MVLGSGMSCSVKPEKLGNEAGGAGAPAPTVPVKTALAPDWVEGLAKELPS